MTVKALIEKLMRDLGEDFMDLALRDTFTTAVQTAYDLILAENGEWIFSYMSEDLNASVGVAQYTLGSTISEIRDIVSPVNTKLTQTSIRELAGRGFDLSQSGPAQRYVIEGTNSSGQLLIRLWPVPVANETYIVYGISNSTALTDDSTIPLPGSLIPALRLRVQALYFENIDRIDMSDRKLRDYSQTIKQLRKRFAYTQDRNYVRRYSDLPLSGSVADEPLLPGDYPR